MYGAAHAVGPVKPIPPHWAQCAAVPELPPAGWVGAVAGAVVVGAGAGDEPVAASLELMKVSAAWPYSVP